MKSLKFIFFLLLIWMRGLNLFAIGASVDSVPLFNMMKSKNRGTNDTLDYINLLYKLKWEVSLTNDSGTAEVKRGVSLEDIDVKIGGVMCAKSTFRLHPELLDKILAIYLNTKGSVWLSLNNHTFLKTGVFATDYLQQVTKNSHEVFREVQFQDSVIHISICFIPPVLTKGSIRNLQLGELSWRDKELKDEIRNTRRDIFTGTFHFAFGVIFLIIFLFHRSGKENLYFASYAILIGITNLSDLVDLPDYLENVLIGSIFLAFELLTIFMAKVVLNKEKTKWPLILMTLGSFLVPLMLTRINAEKPVAAFSVGIFAAILIFYLVLSFLYYLIQGFFQKKWESKFITYGFFAGLLLLIAFFISLIVLTQTGNTKFAELVGFYLTPSALTTFLITMSVVLGRKNGENQIKLTAQLHEIEALSLENLSREKEKQQILSDQNIQLEHKVEARTREVLIQKDIIEQKNKEITDNLTYARRIQSAILPEPELIRKVFPQFFLFYRPRDIVSGDFYTFIQKGEQVLMAGADCTGHGVSGAFMSMIGSSLFNQVVNERNIFDPHEILTQLNQAIIHSLNQLHSESHDGMDIAVCRLNLETGILDYSGANRPLWRIRNTLFTEFKPDKYPIGGMQFSKDLKFISHRIEALPGDTFYMTTDGYADQFGGDSGKKMMTKKFKEMLISIQHLTMEEQERFIQQFFDTWKGANEQVDDVLVIGWRM